MPVVATVTVSYLVIGLEVDLVAMRGTATMRRFVDGGAAGDFTFDCVGDELAALLGATPDPGKTRSADIADTIYAFALSKGYISGTVQ